MRTDFEQPQAENVIGNSCVATALGHDVLTRGGSFARCFRDSPGHHQRSVMTGNLVLLGISIGHTNGALARQIAVAIVGYIAGFAIGVRIAGIAKPDDCAWQPAVARIGGRVLPVCHLRSGVVGRRRETGGCPRGRPAGTQCARPGDPERDRAATLIIRLVTRRRSRDGSRHVLILAALVVGAALAVLLALCGCRWASCSASSDGRSVEDEQAVGHASPTVTPANEVSLQFSAAPVAFTNPRPTPAIY